MRLRLALLLAGALAAGCQRAPSSAPAPVTYVQVARAVRGPSRPALQATGVLVAKDEMRLSFKISGVIDRINVNPGDHVKGGELLATIEPGEIDAQVAQARDAAAKAQRDLQRGRNLQADQVISLEQLQNLQTQADIALAQQHAVEFNLQHARITAPGEATVLRRLAEPRELVGAGTPVLVLGAAQGGYIVRVGLSDRDVVQVHRGDAVQVHLDAWPEDVFEGRISQIAGAADEHSGLFAVEAQLAPTARPLVSGLIARLTLQPAAQDPSPLVYVPIAAVLEGDGGSARVFVAQGGKAQRRDVQVAFITADAVALLGGVREGESVVTQGAAFLDDGDAVHLP